MQPGNPQFIPMPFHISMVSFPSSRYVLYLERPIAFLNCGCAFLDDAVLGATKSSGPRRKQFLSGRNNIFIAKDCIFIDIYTMLLVYWFSQQKFPILFANVNFSMLTDQRTSNVVALTPQSHQRWMTLLITPDEFTVFPLVPRPHRYI